MEIEFQKPEKDLKSFSITKVEAIMKFWLSNAPGKWIQWSQRLLIDEKRIEFSSVEAAGKT